MLTDPNFRRFSLSLSLYLSIYLYSAVNQNIYVSRYMRTDQKNLFPLACKIHLCFQFLSWWKYLHWPSQRNKIYPYFRTFKWLILLYSYFPYPVLFCIVRSSSPGLSRHHCIGGPSLLKQTAETTQTRIIFIVKHSTRKRPLPQLC